MAAAKHFGSARMTSHQPAQTSTLVPEPYENFPVAADDTGLVGRLLDLAQRINPTDLRAENSLANERGDLAEQKEGRGMERSRIQCPSQNPRRIVAPEITSRGSTVIGSPDKVP